MSYSFRIAGDALADLRTLEPWLQEEVLDELDVLAGNPQLLQTSSDAESVIYMFSRAIGGAKHYISITVCRNDARESIVALGIFHQALPYAP